MASDKALKAWGRLRVMVTTPRASRWLVTRGSVVGFMVMPWGGADQLRAWARARNSNFCILPVDVLGIASKRMSRGIL